MKIVGVTISLLFYLTVFVKAGEPTGFSFSEKSVYSFRYNTNDNMPLNNYFIKEIAKFNYLNLFKTNYQLEYEQRIFLTKAGDSSVNVHCEIDPLQLNGDIYYERFNLSDVMIPSVCDFVITIFDEHQQKTATIEVTDCPVSLSAERKYLVHGFVPEQNPGFDLSEIQFKYLPDNKTAFEKRILDINNYLACLKVSGFSLDKIKKINPDKRENTLATFLKIHDLQQLLKYINQQPRDTFMKIPPEYYSGFTSNMTALDSHVRRLTTVYHQNMDTLTFQLKSEDYHEAAGQIITIQKGYLDALLKSNYLFEPVFMGLARFFPGKSGWNNLVTAIKQIIDNPETNQVRFDANEFGDILIKSYIMETDSLIARENFTDAVLMLESAEIVCDAIDNNDCGLSIFHRLSLSKYGIYDSYLSVARSAIIAGNLNLAYKYLTMARDFQMNNSNLIITAGQVNNDLEQLAWLFLESGKGEDYNHLTPENLEYLNNAWDIYQDINVHDFDHLISRLLQKYSQN